MHDLPGIIRWLLDNAEIFDKCADDALRLRHDIQEHDDFKRRAEDYRTHAAELKNRVQ